jgi:hypothetical protein
LLYRSAQRFRSGETQGIAAWLKGFNQVNAEDFWSLVWYEPAITPVPIEKQPTSYYFKDHDVAYWRSSWSQDATAVAFKCGPSEGHHTLQLLLDFPDWRLSSGHAHPDANSFIIFAKGKYLTGDTGYAGVPKTEHHNTLLFGGKGQAKEGMGHDAFSEVDYERLDRIRLTEVKVGSDSVRFVGDATSAYEPEVGVKKFIRTFEYRTSAGFSVRDEVQTQSPMVVTSVIHADAGLKRLTGNRYEIVAGQTQLAIEVSPEDLVGAIEPNVLTAPGPPGSVDKGERQVRGQKLLLSTPSPVTSVTLLLKMKVND